MLERSRNGLLISADYILCSKDQAAEQTFLYMSLQAQRPLSWRTVFQERGSNLKLKPFTGFSPHGRVKSFLTSNQLRLSLVCIVSGMHFLLLVLKIFRFLEVFGIDHTHVRVCVSVESTIVRFFDLCGRVL